MQFGNTQRNGCTFGIRLIALSLVALTAGFGRVADASDVTWTNGSSNGLWDTSSLNWNTGAWNNANGDGAILDATGAGPINVVGPIQVNSLDFRVDGYSLNGTGPLNIVNGVSTQTTGVVNVATGATADRKSTRLNSSHVS